MNIKRTKKLIDALEKFLPKDTGFIIYDKALMKQEDIQELFFTLLESKLDNDIPREMEEVVE